MTSFCVRVKFPSLFWPLVTQSILSSVPLSFQGKSTAVWLCHAIYQAYHKKKISIFHLPTMVTRGWTDSATLLHVFKEILGLEADSDPIKALDPGSWHWHARLPLHSRCWLCWFCSQQNCWANCWRASKLDHQSSFKSIILVRYKALFNDIVTSCVRVVKGWPMVSGSTWTKTHSMILEFHTIP